MKLVVNHAYENMGLASTQTLGPILDGLMRNTPDALEFIETAPSGGRARRRRAPRRPVRRLQPGAAGAAARPRRTSSSRRAVGRDGAGGDLHDLGELLLGATGREHEVDAVGAGGEPCRRSRRRRRRRLPISVTSCARSSAAAGSSGRGCPPRPRRPRRRPAAMPKRSPSIRGYSGPIRVAYVDSHQAASRRAPRSSGAERHRDADGRRASGVGAAARASPSSSSARPSAQARARPQERRPRVGQLAGEPDRSRATAPPARSAPAPRAATPSRSGRAPGAGFGSRSPVEQRAHRGHRLAQPRERPVPRDAVEALGQRRAAGADAEREAPAGAALQAGRAERDGRRRAPPRPRSPTCRARCARSAAASSASRTSRVVRPPLGDLDAVEAQLVRLRGEPHDHVGARLERGEPDADAHR